MRRMWLAVLVLALCSTFSVAEAAPALLHHPSASATQLVFSYGGEVWAAPRTGGNAHALTTGPGSKIDPFVSPDGKWIAFTANFGGNYDVYVMPAEGGLTKRLTFHPSRDEALGWAPDSKSVLFRSPRNSAQRASRDCSP